jgi:DNA-binding NarL/FixJ family response regulator
VGRPPQETIEAVPDVSSDQGPGARERTALRVLIVDDHRTFAELLALGLDSQPDIRCVGHVQSADDAAAAVASLVPDVVLVDVHLGEQDGLEVAAELHRSQPELRVIALTASLDPVNVARAARAGACAYLPKAGSLEDVLNAVRTARPGSLLLSPDMVLDLVALERPSADPSASRPPGTPALTARERQVLGLLGEGLDVSAIAKRLHIRTSTCRGYVQNLLGKLGAHTQLEAVVTATACGLLRKDEQAGTPRGGV